MTGDKDEDNTSLVLDIANQAKFDITPESIERSHRVGPINRNNPRPRQITVKFKNYECKKKKLKFRSNLRECVPLRSVSVNEDLTKRRSKRRTKRVNW